MRPTRVCYCADIQAIDTKSRVLILQHRRERDVPINTARIAHMALTNSEMRVGMNFINDAVVERELSDPNRPACVLFPSPGAIDMRVSPPKSPCTLVVVDGTWWQANKLLKTTPILQSLPRYMFAPDAPSRYRIRREPQEDFVSTIEALAAAMSLIEDDESLRTKLLAPFEAMVERQLAFVAANNSRTRHLPNSARRKSGKARPVPAMFRARWNDVVLTYGEANAWPRASDRATPPFPAEIVQWAAIRPSTGETFEAVVSPTQDVTESFAYYTGLSPDMLKNGETFANFRERWTAFLHPNDVVCTWGAFAADVLEAQGLAIESRIDTRVAAIRHFGGRKGDMRAYVAELSGTVGAPWAIGRAGRRIAELEAVVRGLAAIEPRRLESELHAPA
jgi:DTW domain-containing protein YfiP